MEGVGYCGSGFDKKLLVAFDKVIHIVGVKFANN